MPASFSTARLTLVQRTAADAEWNLRLVNAQPGVQITIEQARARLLRQEAEASVYGFGFYTIRSGPASFGYCGLLIGRASIEEPELAYELLPEHRGFGFATESAKAIVDAAFATGRERLWSTVRPWNTASLRVLDKLGFERERVEVDDRGEIFYLSRVARSSLAR